MEATHVIRLGHSPAANAGSYLAEALLIDTSESDGGGGRRGGGDVGGEIDEDGVSIAELEVETVSRGGGRGGGESGRERDGLHCCSVADSDETKRE